MINHIKIIGYAFKDLLYFNAAKRQILVVVQPHKWYNRQRQQNIMITL